MPWIDALCAFIDKQTGLHFSQLAPSLPFLLSGVSVTLSFTAISLFCGLSLGTILSAIRLSTNPILRSLVIAYVSIFRGTPVLVQLAIVYFATPQITGYEIPAFQAAVFSMSLNSAAYVSEILRGALNGIEKGQWEAASTLGLNRFQAIRYVIFPQAFIKVIPALANEAANILKESALVSTIGAWDLMRRANMISAEKYIFFEPLITVAITYYVLVMLLTTCVNLLEDKLLTKRAHK